MTFCAPTANLRKKGGEFVRVANELLRAVKAGVKIGVERNGRGYLTVGPDKKRHAARMFWPGASDRAFPHAESCATVKLTKPMKDAATEELHYAGVVRAAGGDPKKRTEIEAAKRAAKKAGNGWKRGTTPAEGPRSLRLEATSDSSPQAPHRTRTNPMARTPQSSKATSFSRPA